MADGAQFWKKTEGKESDLWGSGLPLGVKKGRQQGRRGNKKGGVCYI